jgi:hypothetical protein
VRIKLLVSVLILAFAWTLCGPADVFAGWDDNSDELPGMDDGGVTTVLVIGGVVIAGLLIYLLVKNSGDDEEASGENDKTSVDQTGGGTVLVRNGSIDADLPGSRANVSDTDTGVQGRAMSVNPVLFLQKNGLGAGISVTF